MVQLETKPIEEHDTLLRFHSLLIEISTLFISLPVDQIDNKIEEAQKRICKFLDLDRSTLWQVYEQDPVMLLLTHTCQPVGSFPPPSPMDSKDYFPWLVQKFIDGETVTLSKMSELPAEAVRDRDSFSLFDAKSGVYVPLSVGKGPLLGVLTFASMRKERDWNEGLVNGFVLLAQVFANALSRKQKEMSLRESETRLLLTTNAAEAGLWSMTIENGSVWVSEKTRDLFHFSPNEALSEARFYNAIHPEDLQHVKQIVQQAIQTGESFACEYRIELPDGKIRWIAARGQRHNYSDKRLDCLMGVSFDITERMQSELELEMRLGFEKMLAEISTRFVNLPTDFFDSEVEEALRCLCKFLDLDIVVLWQRSKKSPDLFEPTHLYSALDIPQPAEVSQRLFPWSEEQILSGQIVAVSSLDTLPAEAAHDRKSCQLFGIKSKLSFPLSVGGDRPIGILGLNSLRSERDWSVPLVERLQLIAQVFANALERKRMDVELREKLHEITELRQRLEHENLYLQEEVKILADHSGILGQSAAIKDVLAQAEQVAETDSTVLILGETGTGKELLARAIHSMSSRKERSLVTINCATLPSSLIENELFGREKGAYTGAMTKMIGRFELADGSTLFLDEIGELSLDLQSKLLRVLEDGKFERLGSTKSLHINVRIIAATNRDLEQEVANGTFRQDLFYRLNVFPIMIPPLRDRSEDIPLLTREFVRIFQKRLRKKIERIPHNTIKVLKSYPWPGNVRELKNVIERGMILSKDKTLVIELPKIVSSKTGAAGNLDDMTRREILTVLKKTNWRIAGRGGAAEILGLNRSTLHSKMRKLGISRTNS